VRVSESEPLLEVSEAFGVERTGEGGDQSMWSELCVSVEFEEREEDRAWVDELVVEDLVWLCLSSVRTDEREYSWSGSFAAWNMLGWDMTELFGLVGSVVLVGRDARMGIDRILKVDTGRCYWCWGGGGGCSGKSYVGVLDREVKGRTGKMIETHVLAWQRSDMPTDGYVAKWTDRRPMIQVDSQTHDV
jgi:hypothetical protein